LFSSIDPRRIYLTVEASSDLATPSEKSKKRPQVCDFMLQRRPFDSLTGSSNERFDDMPINRCRQRRAGLLIRAVVQKLRRRSTMASDGDQT
jgi:hypothetical protein